MQTACLGSALKSRRTRAKVRRPDRGSSTPRHNPTVHNGTSEAMLLEGTARESAEGSARLAYEGLSRFGPDFTCAMLSVVTRRAFSPFWQIQAAHPAYPAQAFDDTARTPRSLHRLLHSSGETLADARSLMESRRDSPCPDGSMPNQAPSPGSSSECVPFRPRGCCRRHG